MSNKKGQLQFTTKELCLTALFAALTAILAQIAIPLPFTPVPISFGVVAVYTTGLLLKPKLAVFSQICYLLLGGIGMPVFGNFRSGLGVLFGPTGGYLLVYPLVSGMIAMLLNYSKNGAVGPKKPKGWRLLKAFGVLFLALVVLYFGGTLWLSLFSGNSFKQSLALAVYPFIPVDMIKIIFCVLVIVPIRDRLIALNLLQLDDGGWKFGKGEKG